MDLLIYPNPVKGDILNIDAGNLERFDYSIVDILGKLVARGKSEGTINVGKLNKGIYFIKVDLGDDIITTKFIKN